MQSFSKQKLGQVSVFLSSEGFKRKNTCACSSISWTTLGIHRFGLRTRGPTSWGRHNMYARNNVVSTNSAASSSSIVGVVSRWGFCISMEGENKICVSDVVSAVPGSSAFSHRDNLNRMSARYWIKANVDRIKSLPSTMRRRKCVRYRVVLMLISQYV